MAVTIVAKNQTASDITLSNLGIVIPGSSQVVLTDFRLVHDIMSNVQLQDLIEAGDVILNDGTRDLDAAEAIGGWAGHGVQSGGDLHALVTESAHGFMSYTDKIKLNSVVGAGTAHGVLAGLGSNDHPQYQLRTEKGLADGYAPLDGSAKIPISYISGHSTTHDHGGPDELRAQDLGSGTGPYGYVLVTDGAGGWNLEVKSAGTGASGVPVHATTHDHGGPDELRAQDLGSGTGGPGYVLETDGAGGWNLVAAVSLMGGLKTKAGLLIPGNFTGTPKAANVNFATPFPSSNYSVTAKAETINDISFALKVESKTASGFVVDLGTDNLSGLVEVNWQAVAVGES